MRGRWYVLAPDDRWYWWSDRDGWRVARIPNSLAVRLIRFGVSAIGFIVGMILFASIYYGWIGSFADELSGVGRIRIPVWFVFFPGFIGAWLGRMLCNTLMRSYFLGTDRRTGEYIINSIGYATAAVLGLTLAVVAAKAGIGGTWITVGFVIGGLGGGIFSGWLRQKPLRHWLESIEVAPENPKPVIWMGPSGER